MSLLPILATSILLCVLLHLLWLRCFHRSSSTLPLPPGPLGVPVLGALPFIGSQPHASLARLARRYGPIMYLKMGSCPVVVASTPAAARAFLKTHDLQFSNRPSFRAKELRFDGQDLVFANYGPTWKLLRRLSTLHMLSGRALAEWAPIRREEVGHMLRSMLASSGAAVVVPDVLMCTIANIIGRVTMSRRVFEAQGKDPGEFKDLMLGLMNWGGKFNIGEFLPSIAWMDLQGIQRKLRWMHLRFEEMMTRMMAEHAASAHERNGQPDFLDLITAHRAEDSDDQNLSDVNIMGVIINLFLAGTDTASIVIEWAIAELLLNQSILVRAQSEMDRVIGRDRRLEESDIPDLPYLQAVCKEVLRKHPSTPLSIPHFSFEPCEVDGYHIPAGTRLLVNIWAIGRDPDVWEDPLEFNPERFLCGKGAAVEPLGNDFELIPFGAGRRGCVGMQAGLLMVQYILGSLLHSFDWRLPHGEEELNMDECFGLALPKAVPLSVLVTARLAPAAYV